MSANGIPSLLHGRSLPTGGEVRKFEQPWHRAAAYLFAAGKSRKEVAAACDVTPAAVTQLLKNPWFQELVTGIMAESGLDAVETLLKGESINSLNVLIELREDTATPRAVRAAISQDILNRTLGKPVQRIESDTTVRSGDPVGEAQRLAEENARLRRKLGHDDQQRSDTPQ